MRETSPHQRKSELRQIAHARRAGLSAEARDRASEAAAVSLLSLLDAHRGATIAGYWPIRDEIDCRPALANLIAAGRSVCLPVVLGDEQPLQFRRWSKDAALEPAGFGAMAPGAEAEIVVPDVIIVPVLAFDAKGTRLGYGKGFYDRTIANLDTKPTLFGYAYSVQELDHIPADAHDVGLDMVVTETGVQRFVP